MATETTAMSEPSLSNGSRKIVADAFVSMDGVMQAPGGPDEDREQGFAHGGWTNAYWDEVMGQVMGEQMAQPHELLLGRKTYDIFADFWPKHREDPGAPALNAATKYVASRTRKRVDWENSKLLRGDIPKAVQELKKRPGPPIHVLGSSDLLQSLLRHDLVDELEVWVFPVVLGSGKRLFGEGALPTAWKLTGSRTSTTGVTIQHYERAGAIQYGQLPGT